MVQHATNTATDLEKALRTANERLTLLRKGKHQLHVTVEREGRSDHYTIRIEPELGPAPGKDP